MINYLIDFIQNNLIVILTILLVIIVLSFSFRSVRRIMYGGLATGLTTLGFAIMHKTGLGFNNFYEILTRIIYHTTKILSGVQDVMIENRFILQMVSLESDCINSQLCVYDTFTVYNAKQFFVDIYDYFFEIKVNFIKEFSIVKDTLIKKINLSKFSFTYRL